MNDYTTKYLFAKEEDDAVLFLRVHRGTGCMEKFLDTLRSVLNIPNMNDYVEVHYSNHNLSQMRWLGRVTQEDISNHLKSQGFTFTCEKDSLTIGSSWCADSGRFRQTILKGLKVVLR